MAWHRMWNKHGYFYEKNVPSSDTSHFSFQNLVRRKLILFSWWHSGILDAKAFLSSWAGTMMEYIYFCVLQLVLTYREASTLGFWWWSDRLLPAFLWGGFNTTRGRSGADGDAASHYGWQHYSYTESLTFWHRLPVIWYFYWWFHRHTDIYIRIFNSVLPFKNIDPLLIILTWSSPTIYSIYPFPSIDTNNINILHHQ